jgi:hypothetical protein
LKSGGENLSAKLDAEAGDLSPNHGTALHVAVPAQFKFLRYGNRILHIEHGASSGDIAHGAVDDRAALAEDNFPGFEYSTPVSDCLVCDGFVLPHCSYCLRPYFSVYAASHDSNAAIISDISQSLGVTFAAIFKLTHYVCREHIDCEEGVKLQKR